MSQIQGPPREFGQEQEETRAQTELEERHRNIQRQGWELATAAPLRQGVMALGWAEMGILHGWGPTWAGGAGAPPDPAEGWAGPVRLFDGLKTLKEHLGFLADSEDGDDNMYMSTV